MASAKTAHTLPTQFNKEMNMEKIEVYIVPLLTTVGAALHGFINDIEKDAQSEVV